MNLVSPATYRDQLLPFDRKLASVYNCLGLHNCAWNVNPYLDHYNTIPHVAYLDMGVKSDLPRAKQMFPDARRAVMYPPTDLANQPRAKVESDLRLRSTWFWPPRHVRAVSMWREKITSAEAPRALRA